MAEAVTRAEGPPSVPVEARCGCGRMRVPIRTVAEGLVIVRRALAGALPADTVLIDYYCQNCHRLVLLTLADLHLAGADEDEAVSA